MRPVLSRLIACLVLSAAGALVSVGEGAAQELSGTLKHIRQTGTVTIGFRANSIPFSYLSKTGEPIGYAVDLCNEIVDEVSAELGQPVTVAYKPVTSDSRIAAVTSQEIDLECGSTTSNFERKKQVAFSPVYFVSGTKLLVKKSAGIASFRDLKGKSVVVTAGTTNEAAIRAISTKQSLGIKILVGKDHPDSFAMVRDGRADAFATDDVLLYGLIATSGSGDEYEVVGDYISYDPYGLMYRKDDPAFAEIVERRFRKLAESREILLLYDRWFRKRLPSGERLDLPMSPQLEELFRMQGVPD